MRSEQLQATETIAMLCAWCCHEGQGWEGKDKEGEGKGRKGIGKGKGWEGK